jgi:hypothetical protein
MIWDRCFCSKNLNVSPFFPVGEGQLAVADDVVGRGQLDARECSLLVTEPPFNLSSIRSKMDEVVFEKYGFKTYCRMQRTSVRGGRRERDHHSSPAFVFMCSCRIGGTRHSVGGGSLQTRIAVCSYRRFGSVTLSFPVIPLPSCFRLHSLTREYGSSLIRLLVHSRHSHLRLPTHQLCHQTVPAASFSLHFSPCLSLTTSMGRVAEWMSAAKHSQICSKRWFLTGSHITFQSVRARSYSPSHITLGGGCVCVLCLWRAASSM